MKKIAYGLIVVACILIMAGVVIQVIETTNERVCENLPIQDFFNNERCVSYFYE